MREKHLYFFLLVLALCNSEIRRREGLLIFLLLHKNLGKKYRCVGAIVIYQWEMRLPYMTMRGKVAGSVFYDR